MSDVRFIDYLPEVIAGANELKALEDALEQEKENVYEEINKRIYESYIQEAEETGIIRWEKILNIDIITTDTIDDRRFRLLNRLNGDLPYTMNAIKKKLEIICGKGNCKVVYNKEEFRLSVKISLMIKGRRTEVKNILYKRIPANIILEVILLYNNHEEVARFTHQKLSGWRHRELCEEVLN